MLAVHVKTKNDSILATFNNTRSEMVCNQWQYMRYMVKCLKFNVVRTAALLDAILSTELSHSISVESLEDNYLYFILIRPFSRERKTQNECK